jgi:hypothetical protein
MIGSSFELVEDRFLSPAATRLPWEDGSDMTYVESGRQALAIVEAELRLSGHSSLHVPSYLCDSMITPFTSSHWTIRALPVDSNLAVSPEDLLAQVSDGVLLHAPYFGRQDSQQMLDTLEALRQRGIVVVVDETHRVFSAPSSAADIRVASLRKTLPLYDGGYVTGLSGPPDHIFADRAIYQGPASRLQGTTPEELPDGGVAALRHTAMRSKSESMESGDDSQAHRALFAAAEHATETRTQPAPMSERSLSLLHRLDLALMAESRRSNAVLLTETLGHSGRYRVINPAAQDLLPCFLVLEADDVAALQQYLAGEGIYCPIHWPPSELLPHIRPWPARYISLPVDHRYGEPDMLRMTDCVNTFFDKIRRGQSDDGGQ